MLEGLDLGSHQPVYYYLKRLGVYASWATVYVVRGAVLGISMATTYIYNKLNVLLNYLSDKKNGTDSEEVSVHREVKGDQEVPPPKILSNSEPESDRQGETNQSHQSTDDGQEVTSETNAA